MPDPRGSQATLSKAGELELRAHAVPEDRPRWLRVQVPIDERHYFVSDRGNVLGIVRNEQHRNVETRLQCGQFAACTYCIGDEVRDSGSKAGGNVVNPGGQ